MIKDINLIREINFEDCKINFYWHEQYPSHYLLAICDVEIALDRKYLRTIVKRYDKDERITIKCCIKKRRTVNTFFSIQGLRRYFENTNSKDEKIIRFERWLDEELKQLPPLNRQIQANVPKTKNEPKEEEIVQDKGVGDTDTLPLKPTLGVTTDMNEIEKSNLQLSFVFQNHKITILGDNVNPLFVAEEVGAILGIKNVRDTISSFNSSEKGMLEINTPGGFQKKNVLTEAGLYHLIFISRVPRAKAFQGWIFSEVLPSIRRSGSYTLETDFKSKMLEYEDKLAFQEEKHQKLIQQKDEELKQLHEQKDLLEKRTISKWMDKNNLIYVKRNKLYHDQHPDWYKVGRTTNIAARDVTYGTACVNDDAFETVYKLRCNNEKLVEHILTHVLEPCRVSPDREFYDLPLIHLKEIINIIVSLVDGLKKIVCTTIEEYRYSDRSKIPPLLQLSKQLEEIMIDDRAKLIYGLSDKIVKKIRGQTFSKTDEKYLGELKKYVEQHNSFPTERDSKLGRWTVGQRMMYSRDHIHPEVKERLESIEGWSWSPLEDEWVGSLANFKNFLLAQGKFPTNQDGVVGRWFRTQQKLYRKECLKLHRQEKIEEVCREFGLFVEWSHFDARWNQRFNELSEFVQQHKTLPTIKTNKSLKGWIRHQHDQFKKNALPQDRFNRLVGVGIEF